MSGLRFAVDREGRRPGARVVSVKVDGQPLDPARRYTVASNNFMLAGGDGYDALGRGKTLIGATDGKLMANDGDGLSARSRHGDIGRRRPHRGPVTGALAARRTRARRAEGTSLLALRLHTNVMRHPPASC